MTGLRSLFDPQRLRVYPRIMVALYVVAGLALVFTASAMIDFFDKPLGYDFITFWGASHLVLTGHAHDVFNMHAIFAAEQVAVPANDNVYLWHYPPAFLMAVAPLALLPYGLSWFVFVGLSLVAFVLTMRPLFDGKSIGNSDIFFLLMAFPGTFIAVFHGQNSLYTTALFAGGILCLERGRPYLAGLVLGCLIYKPQFGVLLPIAFLVSGQWRALVAMGVSAAAIIGLSLLVFGPDQWTAFVANGPLVREVMESGWLSWSKMPSAFIFLREMGVAQNLAYIVQAATAALVATSVAYVWWREGPTRLSWAVLITGALLVSPYIFDYEFAVLAPVLVILANDMARRGARFLEKGALIGFYLMPLFVAPSVQATHFQVGFPYLMSLLAFCIYRAMSFKLRAGIPHASSLSTPVAI